MNALNCELSPHLSRYVVAQDYEAYTPRDHAVWRHILKRLRNHLKDRAHDIYLNGLEATGIDVEAIPRLETMNEKLGTLGWRCVCVRGFIPPAIFTELQAQGVLAIAADIRSHEHIAYTPAPDIVHESAGHAPIIADRTYAEYLKACGEVGFKAIISAEDRALFEAIRNLSVVKEDPHATPNDVAHAQLRIEAASKSLRYVSESTKASRLYWWSAEYGLIGSLKQPKMYGAGILSSIGEAERCLNSEVLKVPLSVQCTNTPYDITSMQPQLFVAKDFQHLNDVLQEFKATLAWVRGGDYGLYEALRSRSVNHLVLNTADNETLEVTGELREVHGIDRETGPQLTACLVELAGPTMISKDFKCVERPRRIDAVVLIGDAQLPSRGRFSICLPTGIEATGMVVEGHEVIDFRVWHRGRQMMVPTWAYVAVAKAIPSVAGGPADPQRWDEEFGTLDGFTAGTEEEQARLHKANELSADLAEMYREVRAMREGTKRDARRLKELLVASQRYGDEFLLREEIEELLTAQ